MPGRPRTTLKRLNELLQDVEEYGTKLYETMPSRYRSQPDLEDRICAAWQRAGQAAVQSYQAVAALRDQVAVKVARADELKLHE